MSQDSRRGELLSRVTLLVAVTNYLSALGAYMGTNVSWWGIVLLSITVLVGLPVVPLCFRVDRMAGAIAVIIWTFAIGHLLAPIAGLAEQGAGERLLCLLFLSTGGLMCAVSAISMMRASKYSITAGSTQLRVILSVVAVFLTVAAIVALGPGREIVYCLLGALVPGGFCVIATNRKSPEDSDWLRAVDVIAAIFLDVVTFMSHPFRALGPFIEDALTW